MLKKAIIAAGIVVVASASMLEAEPHRGRSGGQHGQRREMANRMAEKLNLTTEQRSEIREIHKREREAGRGLRDSMREKGREYRELERNKDPRAEAVREELKAMKAQMKQSHEGVRSEVGRILTAEQRLQLEQMKEKRHERRGARK